MSLIGNLLREVTKTAANVGEALVHGVADITEVVTGPNELTEAVRDAGVQIVHGAKAISDAVVNMGEEMITGRGRGSGRHTASPPQDESPESV